MERKFYVTGYNRETNNVSVDIVTLNEDEKANIETFKEYFKKTPSDFNSLKYEGFWSDVIILSWSLIED